MKSQLGIEPLKDFNEAAREELRAFAPHQGGENGAAGGMLTDIRLGNSSCIVGHACQDIDFAATHCQLIGSLPRCWQHEPATAPGRAPPS